MEIVPPTASTQVSLNLDTQAQAQNVQQHALRLPMNTVLMGMVAGNDKNGNLIIRLAGNDLILSSPLALSKNAQVALKLENVSGTITAQLLSIDGKLPPTQAQAVSNQLQQNPNQQGAQGQLASGTAQSYLPLKLISVMSAGLAKPVATPEAQVQAVIPKSDMVTLSSPQNNVLKAMVISTTPEIAQILRANMSLTGPLSGQEMKRLMIPDEIKAGTQLNLKLLGQTPPPNNPEQQQIQTNNRTLAKQDWMTKPNASQPNMATLAPPNDPDLPQQKTQQAPLQQQQYTAFQKSDLPSIQKQLLDFIPTARQLPNGNIQLNALVLDTKPNGEMLVETRLGKVIVDASQTGTTISKGTLLTVELTQIMANKAVMALPENEELPLQQLAKEWPSLKGLMQVASDLGQTALPHKLAGVDSLFAARLAGFINAVRNDNLKDWFGTNNYDALESDAEGSQLLGKLRSDFGTLRETFNQPNSNNWQTMLFPVYDGRELHQARLHVKYLPDENQQPDPKTGTRFLVELETTYFGEMQFDGLVHNTRPSKHFDLVVRSHTAMDDEMRNEIRDIFYAASEVTGFKGDIEFATMREFPVKIFEEILDKKFSEKISHKGIEA